MQTAKPWFYMHFNAGVHPVHACRVRHNFSLGNVSLHPEHATEATTMSTCQAAKDGKENGGWEALRVSSSEYDQTRPQAA